MFNKVLAQKARTQLLLDVDIYNEAQRLLIKGATELHELRDSLGRTLIEDVERFISGIADHPKEFDKTIGEFHHSFDDFRGVVRETAQQLKSADFKGASTAGVGVAAGAATAGLAPTAAMAIATTFGTASTGTAISTLSGAAATKAALAWLGGGAIAAGGGGTAGGTALLALAGPIGLGIAGVAVVGGGIWYSKKNKSVALNARVQSLQIVAATNTLNLSISFIKLLMDQTQEQTQGLRRLLVHVSSGTTRHYSELTTEQLESVAAIINHVHVLSELMKRTVPEYMARKDAYEAAKKATSGMSVPSVWRSKAEAMSDKDAATLMEARKAYEAYFGAVPA